MTTPEELAALESMLRRARAQAVESAEAAYEEIAPGDVVQIRPGADRTWESSLLWVEKSDAHHIIGAILRPHRGGCREAWATYSPPEVVRLGRATFPGPAPDIASWCYAPPCQLLQRKQPGAEGRRAPQPRESQTVYRDHAAALTQQLRAERVEVDSQVGAATRKGRSRS